MSISAPVGDAIFELHAANRDLARALARSVHRWFRTAAPSCRDGGSGFSQASGKRARGESCPNVVAVRSGSAYGHAILCASAPAHGSRTAATRGAPCRGGRSASEASRCADHPSPDGCGTCSGRAPSCSCRSVACGCKCCTTDAATAHCDAAAKASSQCHSARPGPGNREQTRSGSRHCPSAGPNGARSRRRHHPGCTHGGKTGYCTHAECGSGCRCALHTDCSAC